MASLVELVTQVFYSSEWGRPETTRICCRSFVLLQIQLCLIWQRRNWK